MHGGDAARQRAGTAFDRTVAARCGGGMGRLGAFVADSGTNILAMSCAAIADFLRSLTGSAARAPARPPTLFPNKPRTNSCCTERSGDRGAARGVGLRASCCVSAARPDPSRSPPSSSTQRRTWVNTRKSSWTRRCAGLPVRPACVRIDEQRRERVGNFSGILRIRDQMALDALADLLADADGVGPEHGERFHIASVTVRPKPSCRSSERPPWRSAGGH